MNRWVLFLWGLLAGAIGAVAAAAILWGVWLLPALGLLTTRVNMVNGAWALLAVGAIGGGIYALAFGRLRMNLWWTGIAGLILGAVTWFGVALVTVPLALGFAPEIRDPQNHWMTLVAFLVWGLIVSLLYSVMARRGSRVRVGYALGLLILSVVAAPLLLRFAISTSPRSLAVPAGYRAEVVAKGLTFADALAVAPDGTIYVGESGYAYGPKTTLARILAIDKSGHTREVARGFRPPLTGLALRGEELYVSHLGTVSVVNIKTGARRDLVTGLPSKGDHQNNDLAFGPDGMLYLGQGTATTAGVVGSDNFVYAWAVKNPDFHDIPSRDWTLTGKNYTSPDLRTTNPADTVTTGAFVPFGTTTAPGQVVKAATPAGGTIIRIDPAGGKMETYADGFRNPYGLAFAPDGTLYATNLGYDDRGGRAVKDSPDWVEKVKAGAWYGWPDYAGTTLLSDPKFASDRGQNRDPLIQNHPAVEPPFVSLTAHESPTKIAVGTVAFGAENSLFIGTFGDGQPLTGRNFAPTPAGVLRIDRTTGQVSWFIKNKRKPRAGRLVQGFKRITAVRFDETGKGLYVLDFGVMEFPTMAPNAIPRTGVLWRVVKTGT